MPVISAPDARHSRHSTPLATAARASTCTRPCSTAADRTCMLRATCVGRSFGTSRASCRFCTCTPTSKTLHQATSTLIPSSSSPRRRWRRDLGLCPCGPCARHVSVRVPLHGVGERAARSTASESRGPAGLWLGCPPPPPCTLGRRAVMVHGCRTAVGRRQVVRLRPELPGTGGQTADRAGAPEIQNECRKRHGPRRTSAEAECRRCRTHMVAPCLGHHWSVVVPSGTVVSASPMRGNGRCCPGSRTVRAGEAAVPSRTKSTRHRCKREKHLSLSGMATQR